MLTLSDPGGGFSAFVLPGFEVVCVEGVIYKANKQHGAFPSPLCAGIFMKAPEPDAAQPMGHVLCPVPPPPSTCLLC